MDAQCDKLATVVDRQFITLSVRLCVQHDGREAAHRAGLSAAAETSHLSGYECRRNMLTTESVGAMQTYRDPSATANLELDLDDGFDAVLEDFRVRHLEKYRQPATMALVAGYAVVFLLSLAGNLLVLVVVLSNKAMRTTTNYFLVNLSVADLLGLYTVHCVR